jgi:hypothetical protein
MAQLNETLIPESELEAERGDFTPLPAGEYKACLVEIGDKDNPQSAFTIANNGKGEYLRTVFEIVEGQYKGRKLFENLQLKRYGSTEKDQTTAKIARGKLSRICLAYGISGSLKDTNQLLNKPPVLVSVKVRAGSGDYGPSNEITNWKSLVPQTPQQYQQPSAPPTQPDPFTPEAQPPAQQPPWGQNNQQQGGW